MPRIDFIGVLDLGVCRATEFFSQNPRDSRFSGGDANTDGRRSAPTQTFAHTRARFASAVVCCAQIPLCFSAARLCADLRRSLVALAFCGRWTLRIVAWYVRCGRAVPRVSWFWVRVSLCLRVSVCVFACVCLHQPPGSFNCMCRGRIRRRH